ncbi:hypothetical protein HYFRA_00012204 [Hymenoscyphus fraxineus]|uniref:Bromo domain-containing protein n=1 Tax=Hymenoscyphus fraxineus TaxID=746836 RepID=A0A9N9PUW8_9HELO|nr:hypothetical protein HYFRA_00012204 [Hymenoscyphus fraxineus]
MATPVHPSDQNPSSMNRSSLARPSIPDAKAAPEISDLYKDCLSAYDKTRDALVSSTYGHATESKFDRDGLIVSLQEARSRFEVWAQNIAAFQPSRLRTSLDYRLREAAGIRKRIVTILQELQDSLSGALPIISGGKSNETWKAGSFSDCESDDETNSQDSKEVVRTSELDELFSAIHNSNAHLMKLSTVIRSSPACDDYLKAASRYPTYFNSRDDIGHVKEKHGKLDRCPDWLVERLGKAITRRRQYLKYREDHHGKLSKDREEVPKEVPISVDSSTDPIIVDPTKATSFIETRIITERPPEDDTGSLDSLTSYDATSIGDEDTHANLTVPQHPTMAFEGVPFKFGEPFQCPYCYTEQVVKDRAAWKKHVFRDLKPYVCTFKECNLRMFRKRAEWFFHEIQNHRRQWTCEHCEQTPCTTKDEFIKHVSAKHGIDYTGSQLEGLIYQSEEPIDKFNGSACHLCDEWGENMQGPEKDSKRLVLHDEKTVEPYGTFEQFRSHLGRHMEQLALFALPRNDGDEMEDQSSGEEEDDVQSKSASAGTATLEAKVKEDLSPPSNDRTRLASLLQAMQKHPSSWPFLSPISKDEVPDYYDVIQEAMDLGTMDQRLAAGNYAMPEPFFQDAMLIFDNCRKYNNETTPYAKSANKLEEYMWAQVREVADWSHLEPRFRKTSSGEQEAGIPILTETSRDLMREFIRNNNIKDQHLIELDHERMNLSKEIYDLETSLMASVPGDSLSTAVGVEEHIPQKKAELEIATTKYNAYLDKLYHESTLKETVELEELGSRERGAVQTSVHPDISPQEDQTTPVSYPDISSHDEQSGSGQHPDIFQYDKQAEDITGVHGTPLKDSPVVSDDVVEFVLEFVREYRGVRSSQSANDSLEKAARERHPDIIKLLLESGPGINQKGRFKRTALSVAASKGYEDIVRLLLQNGADINEADRGFGSALIVAALYGHEHIIKLLLKNGADINQADGRFGNALAAAAYNRHEHIIKLLLENGADITQADGRFGNALAAAAYNRHEHIIKFLLENGADVNQADEAFGSALTAAAYRGRTDALEMLYKQPPLKGISMLSNYYLKTEPKAVRGVQSMKAEGLTELFPLKFQSPTLVGQRATVNGANGKRTTFPLSKIMAATGKQ